MVRPCNQTHKILKLFGSLAETPVGPTEAPTEAPPQTGMVSNVYDREKEIISTKQWNTIFFYFN